MTDKINTLPNDIAERKRLKNVISELVDAQIRLDSEKDLIKGIYEVEKDKHGYDPRFIKSLAEFEYDYTFNEQKKILLAEERIERIAELGILMGRE